MSEDIKKPMSEEKRKQIEKLVISLVAGLVGLVVMWFIFAPSSDESEVTSSGFNVNVPEATEKEMVTDKQDAYAKDVAKSKNAERETIKVLAESMIEEHKAVEDMPKAKPSSSTATEKVVASTEAYRNMNRTLVNFYDKPKVDPEKERMQRELDELKEQLVAKQENPTMGVDEQLALMEKSYELAAKYIPSGAESEEESKKSSGDDDDDPAPQSAQKAGGSLVSSLSTQSSRGFNTAVATDTQSENNTFEACIHSDRTIRNGEKVQIRLLETMIIGETEVPKGAVITGMGDISGERLNIEITQIEVDGMIIPTKLRVIDTDGMDGVHIPATKEVGALKEIVANMSGSMGTTVNLTNQSAGDQILTDLGTSAIDGVSQYVADKIREVKVHLKSGYRVLLYQNKQ